MHGIAGEFLAQVGRKRKLRRPVPMRLRRGGQCHELRVALERNSGYRSFGYVFWKLDSGYSWTDGTNDTDKCLYDSGRENSRWHLCENQSCKYKTQRLYSCRYRYGVGD